MINYDIEYEDVESFKYALEKSCWIAPNGAIVKLKRMSIPHIQNAIKKCQNRLNESFLDQKMLWKKYIYALEVELKRKVKKEERNKASGPKFNSKIFVQMVCWCGSEYTTTESILKRGWGLSCSKHCAATRRCFYRPAGKRKQLAK